MDFWPKDGQFWPKTDIFGQISAFLAHLISRSTKKDANKVPRWFSVKWVPKLGPNTAKFCPNYAFVVILCQILAFFAHLVPCPTKKQLEQGAWVVYSGMWVPKLLFPPVRIRIFCPKKAQFGQQYAFSGT